MPAYENFETATNFSESLASFILGLAIKHQTLTCPGEKKTMPDGSKVITNESGAIIFVAYSAGSTISRFVNYVMCTSTLADHWFRTSALHWLRLN